MMMEKVPRIGIPVDVKAIGDDTMHAVSEQFMTAVTRGVNAVPLLLPALPDDVTASALLGCVDGLLIPGSPSNVAPHWYGDDGAGVGPFDPQRDATTVPLLQAAVAQDMPVLAICRGFQELNVACGGTLHVAVHELPGYMDHRCDDDLPRAQRYALAHAVTLAPGGFLAGLSEQHDIQVNSLHGQGIAELASSLILEATAPDGLIEAARQPDKRFIVGVQWHPEWRFEDKPLARRLFAAFGEAVRRRMADTPDLS